MDRADPVCSAGAATPVRPRDADPMSLFQPASADVTPPGDLRWSLGLALALAGGWTFVTLAFVASSWAEGSSTPWVSDLLWRGLTALIWLAFSPLVLVLARTVAVPG